MGKLNFSSQIGLVLLLMERVSKYTTGPISAVTNGSITYFCLFKQPRRHDSTDEFVSGRPSALSIWNSKRPCKSVDLLAIPTSIDGKRVAEIDLVLKRPHKSSTLPIYTSFTVHLILL